MIKSVCGLIVISACVYLAVPEAAQRTRRDVDSLSEAELTAYLHAVSILKKRPPSDPHSYAAFVRLHNGGIHESGTSVACHHGSEEFLPWHRLLLADFEKALQESDPPMTARVMVPYWDITKPPTGRRFPAVFEKPDSPLWHKERLNGVALASSSVRAAYADNIEAERRDRTSDEALEVLYEKPVFASFGGTGMQGKPGADSGGLESGLHAFIHVEYALGDMSVDSSAANDPLFWSFHSYIDLMWLKWQLRHGGFEGAGPQLLPANLDTAFSYFKTARTVRDALAPSYTYDQVANQPVPKPPKPLILSTTSPADTRLLYTLPDKNALPVWPVAGQIRTGRAYALRFEGVKVSHPGSWQLEVYVHPRSVTPAFTDAAFRSKYFAGYFIRWAGLHQAPDLPDGRTIMIRIRANLIEAENQPDPVVSVHFRPLPATPTANPFEGFGSAPLDGRPSFRTLTLIPD